MVAALPKLPPGDDVVFRRLFDEENGCHLLVSLLNAILAYPPGPRIKTLSLLRSHVAGPLADDKEVILDVRAEAQDGSLFHVEVQVVKHGHEMTEQEVAQLGVPEILEAERKLAMISQHRQIRADYERRRMAHHDAVSLRRDSWVEGKREGLDEGRRQGIDEGKRQGIDEGKRQGIVEGKRQGIDEGKRIGRQVLIDSLIAVLHARGFSLSAAQRARIEAEVDLTRLKDWIARAALADSVDAVLCA